MACSSDDRAPCPHGAGHNPGNRSAARRPVEPGGSAGRVRLGPRRRLWAHALLAWLAVNASAATFDRQPAAADPAGHAFAALGAPAQRQVAVEWNRFYDNAGLGAILARLHEAFPQLTRLYSIGRSVEGRDLWCLEVTALNRGDPQRKPGMYIDGNIHGNEVQASEVVAYTAWYLCHQYGQLEAVTDLLDHCVFYLVPTINPDARDHWFHQAGNAHWPRSGVQPVDDDQDGTADEDDFDDLDNDRSITQMRIKDPQGRWKAHPDYPESLMVRAAPDEPGQYTLLGWEGLDNDGDGAINEDPLGGYDMNRNWAWDWQPNYVQQGALDYPFCLPETRAVAEFVLAHPNLSAFQSYHNALGTILRSPGRKDGLMQPADDAVLRTISGRGERMLPFYDSRIIGKDLYTVWGGEIDWLYGARGLIGFTTELWTMRNLYRGTSAPSPEDQAAFVKYVLLNEGAVKWHPVEHPTYGTVEVGGYKQTWGRVPPSFLLEEECHRNMAFTLYHASQMPRLRISDVQVVRLDDGLHRIRVTVENTRLIPTRIAQDVKNRISPPDLVLLSGGNVRVLSAGRVRDRYFNRVDGVKRRPERVELDAIDGLGAERVEFLVSGQGRFQVTVDSARGGVVRIERELP